MEEEDGHFSKVSKEEEPPIVVEDQQEDDDIVPGILFNKKKGFDKKSNLRDQEEQAIVAGYY